MEDNLRSKIMFLIESLDLSSSQFADIINVKRPIISHILTGRNNPSLDVIHKIVEQFPELQYNWIGEGQEISGEAIRKIKAENKNFANSRELNNPGEEASDLEISNSHKDTSKDKKIVKVVFVYEDDSFKIFHPEEIGFLGD